MKNALSLLAGVALLALAPVLSAQNIGIYTLGDFTGGTNRVASAATNNPTAAAIACSEFADAGIQVSAKGSNGVVSSITFRFAESMDSSNYETTPTHALVLLLNSTTTTTAITNIPIRGTGALKLYAIENPNVTNLATNITVKVRFKAPKVLAR